MTRAAAEQRAREGRAAKAKHDGVREGKRHPWRDSDPGWLKPNDTAERVLPGYRSRVFKR